ncbi:hypothetical protein [Azospirillum rugosum]|uniref:DUF1127 domain-containing protein n=1 Tax=Azospirillum rugosum TaxID=416170 RepID=A0ABS4SGP7_9PROT|nr:hypothetical protein [Azospirillum rugosum]MBP2291737.1 hypothetical protein [Azospirillum rugosum]MDQ0524451.1 hypothetical protein [Azospirillum rugosum]
MRTTLRIPGAALPRSLALGVLAVCRAVTPRRRPRPADPHRFDDRLLRDIGVSRTDLMSASRLGRRGDGWSD